MYYLGFPDPRVAVDAPPRNHHRGPGGPRAAQHLVQRARATAVRCTNGARCAGSAATGSCAAFAPPHGIASPSSNCCMSSPSPPARSFSRDSLATGFELPPHRLATQGFDFRPLLSAAEGFSPFASGSLAADGFDFRPRPSSAKAFDRSASGLRAQADHEASPSDPLPSLIRCTARSPFAATSHNDVPARPPLAVSRRSSSGTVCSTTPGSAGARDGLQMNRPNSLRALRCNR
jgi:hypothetical protein